MATKKKLTLTSLSIDIDCNTTCKLPSLSSLFKKSHKPHSNYHHCPSSSTITTTPSSTNSTTSSSSSSVIHAGGKGRVGRESVPVEKDSDDPYLDFRNSMLQMVMEKEIYSKDDLRELLNCFLQLNEPYHHGIIIRAFTEIWHGVFNRRVGGGNVGGGGGSPFVKRRECKSRDYYLHY